MSPFWWQMLQEYWIWHRDYRMEQSLYFSEFLEPRHLSISMEALLILYSTPFSYISFSSCPMDELDFLMCVTLGKSPHISGEGWQKQLSL